MCIIYKDARICEVCASMNSCRADPRWTDFIMRIVDDSGGEPFQKKTFLASTSSYNWRAAS